MAGLLDLFGGPDEEDGGLLGADQPFIRKNMLPLLMINAGHGIMNANQPGASFGQAVMGGGMNGATSGLSQIMQLQAYQQRMKDAAADRAWKNDQRQALRGQMSAQATLQGGYDPTSMINWNGPRAATPGMQPNERMALMARAYPDHFARQSLEAEFPTPGETERLVTRLAKMPQDDPARPQLEARLAALNTEGGFRYGPGGAMTPVPGGPADPKYLAARSEAIYGSRPTRLTAFERALQDKSPEERQELMDAWTRRQAQGTRGSAPIMTTIYDPATGRRQRHQWDDAAGEWVPVGGVAAPSDRASGTLTIPQQRTNREIDQAWKEFQGMNLSPEEIRNRTSRLDPRTGLANPEYDITLADVIRRARQRKYGDDDPTYEERRSRFSGLPLDDEGGAAPEAGPSAPGDKSGAVAFTPGTTPTHGQVYTLPNGQRAKWDSMKKKFVGVD